MGEQRPKSGAHAQVDPREPKLARRDHELLARQPARVDGSDAPEPTYSEARPRLPEHERTPGPIDADTKVERRASVRPSAFGVPRKSTPAASDSASDELAAAGRLEPHERVLEAARLLDALGPSVLDEDASLYTHGAHEPVQRLPNERARGVEHLVEREAEARTDSAQVQAQLAAIAPPAPLSASSAPKSALPNVNARFVRRPWLSLALFGGMVALSVVPLLRYAQSAEHNQARGVGEPARAATLSLAPTAPAQIPASAQALSAPSAADHPPAGPAREQLIASALDEGTRALDRGDIALAERMFGQVIELAEDNAHAAYGLARVRLRQNNFAGAEGWIQLALRKRPRRAAYHLLYAEVLTCMGRITEAREEQEQAEPREEGTRGREGEEQP